MLYVNSSLGAPWCAGALCTQATRVYCWYNSWLAVLSGGRTSAGVCKPHPSHHLISHASAEMKRQRPLRVPRGSRQHGCGLTPATLEAIVRIVT